MKRLILVVQIILFILIFPYEALASNLSSPYIATIINSSTHFSCKIDYVNSMTYLPSSAAQIPNSNYFLFYNSDQEGYVYIFAVKSKGKVELLYPIFETDDNYINANKRYSYPQQLGRYIDSPVGTEEIVMYVLPEALDIDITPWLNKAIKQNRILVKNICSDYFYENPEKDMLSGRYSPRLNSGSVEEFFELLKTDFDTNFGQNWSSAYTTYSIKFDAQLESSSHIIYAKIHDDGTYTELSEEEKREKTNDLMKRHSNEVLYLSSQRNYLDENSISEESAISIAENIVENAINKYNYNFNLSDMDVVTGYYETSSVYNDWWDICFSYEYEERGDIVDFVVVVNSFTGEVVYLYISNKTLPNEYSVINGFSGKYKRVFEENYLTFIENIEFWELDPYLVLPAYVPEIVFN